MLKNILATVAVFMYLLLAILTFTYMILRMSIGIYETIADHIDYLRTRRNRK
jgi:hypothetical protein